MGEVEGTAIALHLEGIQTPGPMTHAFAASVLQALGGRLREVQVSKLAEEVFYAVAVVEGADGPREVDARPSDALSLALLAGAPIRVAASVLEAEAAVSGEDAKRRETLLGQASEGAVEIAAAATAEWASRASRPAQEP